MNAVGVGFILKNWKAVLLAGGTLFVLPLFLLGAVFTVGSQGMVDLIQESEGIGVNGEVVLGTCAPVCPGQNGPQQSFSVKRALELAVSEVGTSRATGFGAPGECVVSVRRWINSAGGHFASSAGVVGNYQQSGALRVTDGSLRPGDVVQYEHQGFPNAWLDGVHTYMVLAVNADGTHDIVESNVPYGSGRVGIRKNQRLQAPLGFAPVVWRFASEPDL